MVVLKRNLIINLVNQLTARIWIDILQTIGVDNGFNAAKQAPGKAADAAKGAANAMRHPSTAVGNYINSRRGQ